jgi:glycosyltransferase involved in cell wall biosynthesis
MRIAQIAPLAEAVPPKLYGGTERVVHWLTEDLVALGHDVTLFASGDSVTSAKLVPCSPTALRLAGVRDQMAFLVVMLDRVRQLADQFDVLHFHIDILHYPVFQALAHKSLTTLHGRLDLLDHLPAYRAFSHMPFVSISDAQRKPVPFMNYVGTVHHGLPVKKYIERGGPGDYLAFLGRISPEKGPDRAIEIACRAGMRLKIAAKVDPADHDYFESCIRPLLQHPLVEYIGEITEQQKPQFLSGARALLFPIDWPEPFGLVMIEAMSVGTPVIAFSKGSVPEVIDHGVSGLVVGSVEEAISAVSQVESLKRRLVRECFSERFTATRMARDYVRAYERLLSRRTTVRSETEAQFAA